MANASSKKIALQNQLFLKTLHRLTIIIYFSCYVTFYVAKNSYKRNIIFSIPGILALLYLDKSCRPLYDANRRLLKPGLDISQSGIIEYLKDTVFLSWICILLAVAIGAKAWFLMLLVPGYLGYKGLGVLKAGKNMMQGAKRQ